MVDHGVSYPNVKSIIVRTKTIYFSAKVVLNGKDEKIQGTIYCGCLFLNENMDYTEDSPGVAFDS